ncbi:hypothetical protein [Halomonas sp.]|uniref:hypothetical protein n=1 Tax=Halomonas sp. TaxID=1486246 RepID=UPI00356B03DE
MTETKRTSEVEQYLTNLDFDPTTSEHTNLDSVPKRAEIKFEGDDWPRTNAVEGVTLGMGTGDQNDAMMDEVMAENIGVRFLIERAMLDPDTTVIPREP